MKFNVRNKIFKFFITGLTELIGVPWQLTPLWEKVAITACDSQVRSFILTFNAYKLFGKWFWTSPNWFMQFSLLQLGFIMSKNPKMFHLCRNCFRDFIFWSKARFSKLWTSHACAQCFFFTKPEKKKHPLSQLYYSFASLVLGSKIFYLIDLTTFTFSF